MIAVFDSGIGGLDVLHKLSHIKTNFFYYADTENFPYGNKTEKEIAIFLRNAFDIFIRKKVSLIVLACNTAAVVSNKIYGNNYKGIKIIDTLLSLEKYENIKNLTILCTQTTKNSLINNAKFSQHEIIALPLLASYIEDFFRNNCDKNIIIDYLKNNINKKIKKILYTCTHYPLIDNLFKEIFTNTIFYNPANEIATEVITLLKKTKYDTSSIEFSDLEIKNIYKTIYE